MRQNRFNILLLGLGLALLPAWRATAAESVADVNIDIAFKKFVLTNGLTLIVHEDHKAPIVHPDELVWIVVGDRAKVESAMRELGWGEIQLLDSDGDPAQ
jgi:hypothetical protein